MKIRDVEGTKKLPRGKNIAFEEAAKCMFVRMHECTIKTSILQEHNITLSEHCFYVDIPPGMKGVPHCPPPAFFPCKIWRGKLRLYCAAHGSSACSLNDKSGKVQGSIYNNIWYWGGCAWNTGIPGNCGMGQRGAYAVDFCARGSIWYVHYKRDCLAVSFHSLKKEFLFLHRFPRLPKSAPHTF